MTALLVAACVVATVFACDRDVPEPADERPDLRVLQTLPEAQEPAWPLDRAMRIRFDRYLRPASVIRQSVWVSPGLFDSEAGVPKGPLVFFKPVYDPYERMVVFQLAPGDRWTPTTLHSVKYEPPQDESDVTGFSAFDGAPLAEAVRFTFMTGDAVSDPDHDVDDNLAPVQFCETDEASDRYPAAYEVLRGSCGSASCHGGPEPLAGLDLSSPQGIRGTAIRVAARQTSRGASVGAPVANARRFGDDMPRVDPGNAGNSYLVYKLLINGANHPATGETLDDDPWLGGLPPPGPPSWQELSRLRSWFVQGEPMPRGGHLSSGQMRSVVRWILQGAETPACP